MGSERITYGKINAYLGAVDAVIPSAPNITPDVSVWTEIGESFLTDDALTLTSAQELAYEMILNETNPVHVYRLTQDLMVAFSLKDFALEVVQKGFNNNPIVTSAPSATDVGYLQMSLEQGIAVTNYALLVVYHASPYDMPNVITPDFKSHIYLPRCNEMADFESAMGAKQPAMTPLSFRNIKSDTAANFAQMRVANLAHT